MASSSIPKRLQPYVWRHVHDASVRISVCAGYQFLDSVFARIRLCDEDAALHRFCCVVPDCCPSNRSGFLVNPLGYDLLAETSVFVLCPTPMTASGRKRAFNLVEFDLIEWPLLAKADICALPGRCRTVRSQGVVLIRSELLGEMVPVRGFEPRTSSLRMRRSTN